jgi:chaperone BCS1
MDMHIHMSWCTFPAFQILAYNNLGLETHALFPEVEKAIFDKAITPADVSELLLKKKRDSTAALEGLIQVLLQETQLVSELPAAVNFQQQEKYDTVSVTADGSPLAADESGAVEDLKANAENLKACLQQQQQHYCSKLII